ncbi:zf-HC2 domain-containing protein [Streptomyces sp. JB150]|uniref:anti-sigma factor family protein n=1 Tax=Streptomyces sp. JB150 TaxID=2714844 RepID=UPI0014093E7B|nr:zf-HC2 domain-containing protein [Streptomyces sp. JB150]QIJ64594.1 zf-HC2 domain-containing protein [Streptomyces sp. JB150]
MSGSRPKPAEGHLAEQHLGDRLAALVDGELGHDARERVLAHVATCPKCKAEVDAQRRLKNVFAEAAPPPPSESFLARLQGLPGGSGLDGGDAPFGGSALPGGLPGRPGAGGVFGLKRGGERFELDYLPARTHTSVLPAAAQRGFRIHDVGRSDGERASRGRRFAFVAAGAVSLAAIALGGVTTGAPGDPETRGGSGSNVTPMRTPGTGTATAPDSQRRRAVAPLLAQIQGGRALGETPAASTGVSAPLLPGVTSQSAHALTTPPAVGAATLSPLIRPLTATPPVSLTGWSMAHELTTPGLLTASPTPDPSGTRPTR